MVIRDLFDAFADTAEMAGALRVSTMHVRQMRRRGSIPVDYWPALIAAAAERGIAGVTYETLALMHAKPQTVVEPLRASP